MDGGRVEKRWRAISGEEGRGEEEEGSGVARQLRTSESKFHKKNICRPGRTGHPPPVRHQRARGFATS